MRYIVRTVNSHVEPVLAYQFAGDIEDEVTLRDAVQHEQADLDHASSLSFNFQLSDALSRNNYIVEKMLEIFQSTTIHALESSFVKAIENSVMLTSLHMTMASKLR